MKRTFPNRSHRRGAVAVLTALLLVGLLGMLALAIDAGWIALAKSELQNAADAAALAGAEQLLGGYVSYNLPGQSQQSSILTTAESSATSYSKNFASYNSAGGVASLVLKDADIQFGFTDAQGHYTPIAQCGGYPNTVQVLLRRDGTANNPLNLFFANIFGTSNTTMTATAAATTWAGRILTFDPNVSVNGLLLPVALDINHWNQFLANGRSPDGAIHAGPNGAPQLQVYPCPGNAPGNFGLLCTGPPQSSANAFRDWIDNGPTPDDLRYLADHGELPVSLNSPEDWSGGPGLKSTLLSNFSNAAGQPRLIAVFQPVSTNPYQAASGSGSNSWYDVVGFVGAAITQADGSGSSMNISVQPCAVLDPTAVYDTTSVAPTGTATQVMTTVLPPRLSQ